MRKTQLLFLGSLLHQSIMSSTDAGHVKANKTLSSLFSSIGNKTTKHEEQLITTSKRLMPHLIAPLVAQLGITERSSPVQFFDNACGSGVLTQEVQKVLPKNILQESTFFCSDNAEGMVNLVKKRTEMEGWVNVEERVLNAMVCCPSSREGARNITAKTNY